MKLIEKHKLIITLNLYLLIVVHLLLVFANIASLFILPFAAPFYISLPVCSLLVNFMFNQSVCPLTKLENRLRRMVGWPEIRGFVGHYLVKPAMKIYVKVKHERKQRSVA